MSLLYKQSRSVSGVLGPITALARRLQWSGGKQSRSVSGVPGPITALARRLQRSGGKNRRLGAVAVISGFMAIAACVTPAQAQEGEGSGEVRRVDVDGGKITIKHGAIEALQLPAMALVYRASPDLIRDIQPGDKITFVAKRDGDIYVVIKIRR